MGEAWLKEEEEEQQQEEQVEGIEGVGLEGGRRRRRRRNRAGAGLLTRHERDTGSPCSVGLHQSG